MRQESMVVLDAELKRLRDGAFEAWKIYMAWYTWFFGANLIVLGWVLTKDFNSATSLNTRVLAAVWIIFNAAGVVSTLRLRAFTRDVTSRTDDICQKINAAVRHIGVDVELTSGYAGRLSAWGAGANAVSLSVNVLVWTYVFFWVAG
jgi:hypothetical protein